MKGFKTVAGLAITLLGFVGGPEFAPLLTPIFGGTLPGWVTKLSVIAGLLFALYGRWKAETPIFNVSEPAPIVRPQ